MKRRLEITDIKAILLELFGKNGRGFFEVRSSPEDDGTEEGGDHTCDANLWDTTGYGEPRHNDLDFPVCSYDTKAEDQKHWPDVYEGISFDLYVREPDEGDHSPSRDDWDGFGNADATLFNGEWVVK